MLGGESYIVEPKTGSLHLGEIEQYLRSDPLIAPAPNLDDAWFTATDREDLRYRVDYAKRSGKPPSGGVLIYLNPRYISLYVAASVAENRIALVRFLEWLQSRCEVAVTEAGYGPSPELERIGVRAFLPEAMRDQVDALYEEAVRRDPQPTIDDEMGNEDQEDAAH